jgi:hypothetical protein
MPLVLQKDTEKGLLEHLALYPGVLAYVGFWVAALGAALVALVI